MNQLSLYLETIHPTPKKKPEYEPCCYDKRNIQLSPHLLLYVCIQCGVVHFDIPHQEDMYDKFKNPHIVKTYIPYQYKYRHLHRINKWGNYSYKEVQLDKLLNEIENVMHDRFDRQLIDRVKALFTGHYDKLSIRAKIKDSLVAYCIYKISIEIKKPVDLDEIMKLLNVSVKNYNDLNKKLPEKKLFYPKNINDYLGLIDNKIEKNYLIIMYNDFLILDRKFNNKSILLGLIYYILSHKPNFIKKEFYENFDISKSSIKNISKIIVEHKLIDIN